MLKLASFQRLNKKDDEHAETLERGNETAQILLERISKDEKLRRDSVMKFQSEFLEMLFHLYSIN